MFATGGYYVSIFFALFPMHDVFLNDVGFHRQLDQTQNDPQLPLDVLQVVSIESAGGTLLL